MFVMELPKHFACLRDISDNVDDYLGRELWKEEFANDDDSYGAKNILGRCYAIILEELKDYGIGFTFDYDDLTSDIYLCGYVYLVRRLVDSKNLKQLILATGTLDRFYTYLQSEEDKPDIFKDTLELLESKTKNFEINEINYIVDNIFTNHVFTEYLTNLVTSLRDDTYVDIVPELVRVNEYIKRIKLGRQGVAEKSKLVAEKLDSQYPIDAAKLNKLLNDYDMDKISPEEVKMYALIDTEDEINPALLSLQHRLLDAHHLRSPHHIEYWLNPDNPAKQEFTIENLIVLVAHHADQPMTDESDFRSKCDEMLDKGKDFLGPNYLSLAKDIETIVATSLDNLITDVF